MIVHKLRQDMNVQKNLFVALALLGMWCFFLWNAFAADRSFALYMDNEFLLGPILSTMSSALRSGEWPLRFDSVLGGIPLYNSPQLSVFYPFYLAVLPIFKGVFDVIYSMHWITLVHFLIFEINMYVFLRVIGTSRLAALTGAALVAFSANSFTYAVWVTLAVPYSWIPLYLAGLIGVLKKPQSMRYSTMALGGIVLLALASPAQPLIHAVFVTVVFFGTYCWHQLRIGETSQIPYTLGRVLIIGVLALLLVSPVILPALLGLSNMIRWIGPFPAVIGNAPIPFEAFQFDQLSIADLGGIFFKFKSAAVGQQFVGVIPIALAAIAWICCRKSWVIIALAFIAIYALISATGSNLGLAYVNYNIPILNKIREPSRFLVLFQFSIGVLAALGIDELRRMVLRVENQHQSKCQWLVVSAGIGVIALFTSVVVQDHIVSGIPSYVVVAILFVLILLTWMVARSGIRGRDFLVAVAWGGTSLALLAIEVPWSPPLVSNSTYLTSGAVALENAIDWVKERDPHREYRVVFDGKINKQEAAMLASYHRVRTLNAYFNPLPYRQFLELYYQGARADNYFRILGAKYLICNECNKKSLYGYNHIQRIDGYDIYESKDVLPHHYIVQRIDGVFNSLADFTTKAQHANLTKKLLYVEPDVALGLNSDGGSDIEGRCISREDMRSSNLSRFLVQCKSSGVFVLNEFFNDAWKATVDGVKVTILRVNGNQMGVLFPAGSHVIEFRYLPVIFQVSLALMAFGLGILIVIFFARRNIFYNKEW